MQNKNFLSSPYYVGIDIGTDSVGYAVTGKDYSPCKFKGEPMLGVTLFDAAGLCADRRSHRTARRRYDRRQTRVDLIQELLCAEISKIDPYFFIRMSESYLCQEEKTPETLEGCDWEDRNYHLQFPTIHHLILTLMRSSDGLDMRHIYLAIAWLVAHRGHFLSDIDCERIEDLTNINPLYADFEQWFDDNGYARPWNCDAMQFGEILSRKCGIRSKETALNTLLFGSQKKIPENDDCPLSTAGLIKLFAGGKIAAKKLFKSEEHSESDVDICLDDPEKLEEILPELGDDAEIIRLMSRIYDCALLSVMLDGKEYISEVKVKQYDTHKKDLADLKYLIRKYLPSDYNRMFRSAAADGYSAYVSNFKACANDKKPKTLNREDFYKHIKKELDKIVPRDDDEAIIDEIRLRIESKTYMPKQVNPDNRLIPHQLYYAELNLILKNAAKTFPFLNEKDADGLSVADKIRSVFRFRIPYYVGPLNSKSQYAWIQKKADATPKEVRILPWNFDEIVDLDASEDAFVKRMTNKCTYLPGEDVLPKCSLLYSKFTVLNSINNICIDGIPLSVSAKQDLFNELFKKERKVTYKKIVNYLISVGAIAKNEDARISGLDTAINVSCKPYVEFSRLLSSGTLTENDVETIILRLTCTEDTCRFRRWLEDWLKANGKQLSPEDIKYIASRKYKDFGRLSSRLLNGIEGTNLKTGEIGTVLHFLWNTEDNLMQILADKTKYTFCDTISDIKKEYFDSNPTDLNKRLNNMGLSNAVKRPVIRTLDIISDIVKARKCCPEKIFVEMARGPEADQKNKRTVSRKDQLAELYKNISNDETAQIRRELEALGDEANNRLQSEALFLYFSQLGKCMYCGKPLDISLLGSGAYDIDHIWPRAYIKDDSIHNNKVLVHKSENGEKTDKYPLPSSWHERMYGTWKHLHDCNLISDEKFKRLIRSTPFSEDEKQGFINRQLVETRQSTKAVTELLQEKYPDTEIVFVKSDLVSTFRNEYGEIKDRAFNLHLTDEEKKTLSFVKSRTANDIHHAQDAYLNIVVGNLFHEKFTRAFFSVTNDSYSLNFRTLFGKRLERDPEIWDPQKHLPVVEKAMANMHIHLTKYQVCKKGGFYDQNPVSAGSGELVPLKRGLDTEKYGGYNKPTVSFYTLVRYRCKKTYELKILPCELMIADKYLKDPEFAANHIRSMLPKNAEDISKPLGDRILKINTVFSLDGFEVCLAGKTNEKIILRSLTTPRYSAEWIRYIKKIENVSKKLSQKNGYHIDEYAGISPAQNMALFDYLVGLMNGKVYSKQPGGKLCVCNGKRDIFEKLDIESQCKCLENMLSYLKTNRSGSCNMKTVKGGANEGAITLNLNISNWKKYYTDVRIIDRTASGLYEKRSDNLLELL